MFVVVAWCVAFLGSGCGTSAPPKTWDRPIVCQPHLIKADESETHQGTGFFVRAPNGKLAAVSASHFLDFDGSPVVEAEWLSCPKMEVLAKFRTSWGLPGRKTPGLDHTTDFWIMPVAEEDAAKVSAAYEILEFDPRGLPEVGEPVWLPNKSDVAALGHTVFEGQVRSVFDTDIAVILDGDIGLQSQSGSPIISRRTHKVVGTLYGGNASADGKTALTVAPITKMQAVLNDTKQFPELRTVIGRTAAP